MIRVYRIFMQQCLSDTYFVLFYLCDLRYFDVILCPSSRQILATPLITCSMFVPSCKECIVCAKVLKKWCFRLVLGLW